MSEEQGIPNQEDNEITCVKLWRVLPICKGDKVEVYPRGMRSMIMIRGKIIGISEYAIVIENDNELFTIRLNEIRMLRKLNNKDDKK